MSTPIGTWLRNRRHQLPFVALALSICVVALCLLFSLLVSGDGRHIGQPDYTRTFSLAFAFIALGGTFNIAAVATAPTLSRGRDRPLPRVVAWGMLAPLIAECGIVWFGLQNASDSMIISMVVAFMLNGGGQLGALALRARPAAPGPGHTDAPPAPAAPVSGT